MSSLIDGCTTTLANPWLAPLPFAGYLLSLILGPMLAPHIFEQHRYLLLVAMLLGLPVIFLVGITDPTQLWHTTCEYAAFVILLGSLYLTTSGIGLHATLPTSALSNTCLLLVGSLLASLLGTTGASMLLIKPLLKTNAHRQHQAHVVLFFIFLVGNIGGLLTPLGDPPLFLGYLRGVPFTWTLRLWPMWLLAISLLLVLFYLVDAWLLSRKPHISLPEIAGIGRQNVGWSITGTASLVALPTILVIIATTGIWHLLPGLRELLLVIVTALAWWRTCPTIRQANQFSIKPLLEVVIVFAGIFSTMMPTLTLLQQHGASLGISQPWQFFWVTGLLSSFLDNAPTYLTFTTTAAALLHTSANHLDTLIASQQGNQLLTAISLGAVMMGALTYLGNAPNLLIRALATQHGVRMPNFLTYIACSSLVLLPLFGLITYIFLLY